jgi:hypothetical protein
MQDLRPSAEKAPVTAAIVDHVARLAEQRRFRQARGMFPSEKMRSPVSWTTLYQRDAMMLLELQHGVVDYEAWPVCVHLRVGAELFEYHPSLGLTMEDGRKTALDMFSERDCTLSERSTFEAVLRPALAEQGYGLIRVGEQGIRQDRCLTNAREVIRSAGWPVGEGARFGCVRRLAQSGGSATLGTLAAEDLKLSGTARVLAMRRVLAIDLRSPSLADCVVRLPPRVRN